MRFLMCPPSHFGVEYVINPWMQGQVHATDRGTAYQQWSALHAFIAKHAAVDLLAAVPGLPDLVFTANAALIHRGRAILSNFRCPERQPEAEFNARWFTENGFTVSRLPPDVFFEGAGDALLDRAQPLLWMGHGFRSDIHAQPHLEAVTQIEVQPLRLCDPRFYHLDTCFCPLQDGFLLYYPGAFDKAGIAAIEAHVPSSQRLPMPDSDAVEFACNAVNIGSKIILNQASGYTTSWLSERGFDVTRTDLHEFMKAGGAAKCLSLRLLED